MKINEVVNSATHIHESKLQSYLSDKVEEISSVFERFETFFPPESSQALERAINFNHYCNCQLWSYEDRARDPKADDSIIAHVKRVIDKLNQRRNDQIEVINDLLLELLPNINEKAPLFSETPGSVVDRLSITNLKIFHMDKAADEATDSKLKAECQQKYATLKLQRDDLQNALVNIFSCLENGEMSFRPYRQYKMYNDNRLNPYLKN